MIGLLSRYFSTHWVSTREFPLRAETGLSSVTDSPFNSPSAMGGGASSEVDTHKPFLHIDECAQVAGPFWAADIADEIRPLLNKGLKFQPAVIAYFHVRKSSTFTNRYENRNLEVY